MHIYMLALMNIVTVAKFSHLQLRWLGHFPPNGGMLLQHDVMLQPISFPVICYMSRLLHFFTRPWKKAPITVVVVRHYSTTCQRKVIFGIQTVKYVQICPVYCFVAIRKSSGKESKLCIYGRDQLQPQCCYLCYLHLSVKSVQSVMA